MAFYDDISKYYDIIVPIKIKEFAKKYVETNKDEKMKYIDEVAVIKAIKDGREAMIEFTK